MGFNDNSVAHKARMCTEMLQTADKIVDLHCSGAALSVLADLDLPACQETGSELEEMNSSQWNRCRKGLKDNDSTCPSMWCWSDMAPSCSTTASPASSRSSSPSRSSSGCMTRSTSAGCSTDCQTSSTSA